MAVFTRNLNGLLRLALRGTPTEPLRSDLAVESGRTYRLPDAVVSCSRTDDRDRSRPRALVTVFEVLSRGTCFTDSNAMGRE